MRGAWGPSLLRDSACFVSPGSLEVHFLTVLFVPV